MKYSEVAEHIVYDEFDEVWTCWAKGDEFFGCLVIEHFDDEWTVVKPNNHCVACANKEEAFAEAEFQLANVWQYVSEEEKNAIFDDLAVAED